MTRYRWITVTGACLLLGQASARADTIPKIVAKTKPSVAEIVTIDEIGWAKGLGTGLFILPDGQAVTNRPLVAGASSIAAINNNKAIIRFWNGDEGD